MSFIFNEETLYFTVFGGDFIMDDLKKVKNTEAWVWYKNCDSKNKNVAVELGNDSNLLIVFYVQIMPDDFVMQLHRF